MKGNFHVQFLGEGVAATSPPYPTPGWATTQVYPARITPLPGIAGAGQGPGLPVGSQSEAPAGGATLGR